MNYLLIISLLILILLLLLFGERKKIRKKRHSRYLKKAEKILVLVHGGNLKPGQVFSYLRKTNPYVFEELVLLGFSENGYEVKRNKSYSGDGGIDGRVVKDGQEYLVQCKRYSKHINLKHVQEFARLCREEAKEGFFVHTGKTGRASRLSAHEFGNVEIISGYKLLNFLKYNNYLNDEN